MNKIILIIVLNLACLLFSYIIIQNIEDIKTNNPEYEENQDIVLGWKLALIPLIIPPAVTILYCLYQIMAFLGWTKKED